MATITVSIGRNVGSEPMADSKWRWFQQDVMDAVEQDAEGTIYFIGCGQGIHEGAYEDSFTIVGSSSAPLHQFKNRLSALTTIYRQQSIALTVGKTEFIEAL